MGFDKNKFLGAGWSQREQKVKVPELADCFDKGTDPVFTVKALTGHEYWRVQAIAENYTDYRKLVSRLIGGSAEEQAEGLKSLYDMSEEKTPKELVRCLALVRFGCVEPVMDEDFVSRLCQYSLPAFTRLVGAITGLTNLGYVPGKQKASGATTESEAP